MAYSDQTMEASMTMGIPGTPALMPQYGHSITAEVLGTGTTYAAWEDATILAKIPSCGALGANFYASTIDNVIFTPSRVVQGVTVWKIEKPANSWESYFRMYDENNNIHYECTVNFEWSSYNRTQLDFYVDNDWSLNLWNDTGVYLQFACDPTDPNWHYSICWIAHPTPLTQDKFKYSEKVNYVNGMGANSLTAIGGVTGDNPTMGFDDYIDALFNGVYTNAGQVAPTGGAAGGGGGSFDRPDYEVGVPDTIQFSITDTGMVSLWAPTTAQLQTLGTYLWSSSFFDNIIKNFQSPFDNIITLQLVPLSRSQLSTQAGEIKIGNIATGVNSVEVTKQFYKVSCGTLRIPEVYHSFADYSPYTPALGLYLPYCGIIQLQPDEVVSGRIKVDYQIDIFSGTCCAYVSTNTNGVWHVIQQRAGNCSVQFPITGANFASVYIGAVNSIASLANGNLVGAMGQAANIKPEYGRSGGITSTAGLMGVQYPYLIIEKPNYIIADTFKDVKGYTSNLTVTISSCSGFLQATADNSELNSIGCTEEERDYIRRMLEEGIYL